MTAKIVISWVFLLFYSLIPIKAWAQTEPVRAYYDSDNDWFVFEWERPDYGKVKTIYDSPNKIKPIIASKASVNQQNMEYVYEYEVTNQTGAKQVLYDIVVKYLSPIYEAESPTPSADWHAAQFRGKDAWHWAKTGGAIHGISSGESEKGFSFKSKGLPTIVNVVFLGRERKRYSPPGDYDTDEVADSFERVFKSLEEKYKDKFEYVTKKTLGPGAPPTDLKPIEFVDNIIKMKHEAFSLGWIKNEGTEKSLDAKLDNVKKKLDQGSPGAAKNILNAFINEVEAQGCATYENCPPGKHLTSEAYALLKYNAQYLIDNLK